jgi:transcriptional regulator with GAF, ATPase, and Fis domain
LVVEGGPLAGRSLRLHKPLMTLGSAAEADLSFPKLGLEPSHAAIVREADGHYVEAFTRDLTVNARREKRRRLDDGDVLRLGELTLVYRAREAPSVDAPRPSGAPPTPSTAGGSGATAPSAPTSARPSDAPGPRAPEPRGAERRSTAEVMAAYQRLYAFTQRLARNEDTPTLVRALLEAVVELTGADKGLLLLRGADAGLEVAAAVGVGADAASAAGISDSIVAHVLTSGAPLVVSNAVEDQAFSASASVVNLKLRSVMCAPVVRPRAEGSEILGVVYVGNDRVRAAFDAEALEVMTVFVAQASLLLSQATRLESLQKNVQALSTELEAARLGAMIGASDVMREIGKRVRRVATTDVAVLITGETGTGKELVARELHRLSRRASGPFVVVNCGAIPENLLESELFGHVRGAFTGAIATRPGKFQAASSGTLFLDEIGELPLPLQVKLLRALQDHFVTKVGDTRAERVDIRVLAATNRHLEREIREGRFREDLYYRLNVVEIGLPPLRERGEDLVLIARYLLAREVREQGRAITGFSRACVAALRAYGWPGNVRQLENRVKKAVVLAEGPLVTAEDMDLQPADVEETLTLAEARARFEARYIQEILDRHDGNRTQTAKALGVDPRTIFRYLAKWGSGDAQPDPIPAETHELGAAAGLDPSARALDDE